jgi:hypothetical protein
MGTQTHGRGQFSSLGVAFRGHSCRRPRAELTVEIVAVALDCVPDAWSSPRLLVIALALEACLCTAALGRCWAWSRVPGQGAVPPLQTAAWLLVVLAAQTSSDRPLQLAALEALTGLTMRLSRAAGTGDTSRPRRMERHASVLTTRLWVASRPNPVVALRSAESRCGLVGTRSRGQGSAVTRLVEDPMTPLGAEHTGCWAASPPWRRPAALRGRRRVHVDRSRTDPARSMKRTFDQEVGAP